MTQTRYDMCAPPLKVPKGGVLTAAPAGVPQSHHCVEDRTHDTLASQAVVMRHTAMGAFDTLAGWGWVMGGITSGMPMA